jgi:hypothetical protein
MEGNLFFNQPATLPFTMSSTILYHGNCIDGFTAAFLAHTALTEQGVADIKMYPVAPTGVGLPHLKEFAGRHILMVDISFDQAKRAAWTAAGALSIQCIDHHATSCSHWSAEANPIHVESCAALQVFRHFFPQQEVPFWLEVIDRIDRWDNPTDADRCVRELLNIMAHKPVQHKDSIQAVLAEMRDWIALINTPEGQVQQLTIGKALLDKKEASLCQILEKGTFLTIGFEQQQAWQLPASWLGANLYLIDNTDVLIDTTEASHIIFVNRPGVDVFINYRRKSFVKRGGFKKGYSAMDDSDQKNSIIYYARSRNFNLTEGTIFRGHPTAAGATLIQGEAPHFPFLLTA